MSVAALTSSISMLEGPVSYIVERYGIERVKATTIVGIVIFILSTGIISNIGVLLDFVATLATEYGQPIIAMLCCVFVGWIWHRTEILKEIQQGYEKAEHSFFWKVWPWYTKFICPTAIAIVFIHSL